MLSAASCVATLLAQERAVITIRQLTFGDRVGNAVVSYVAYLGQMIWPAGLAVVYPYPEGGLNIAQALLASLVLLIISVVFFIWRGKYPFLLIGWLWFLGMLVPMIGIVQVGAQARADRYTYLAQIGLYLLVTWGAMELFAKWRRGREVLIAIALLIVTGLMADSYFQTSSWRNSETLWNQALANTSNNHIAQNNLGNALMKKGRLDEAVVHFRKALEIYADYPEANNNLGYALASKGNWADAIASYRAAMRARPNYPKAHNNLAISLAKGGENGRSDRAIPRGSADRWRLSRRALQSGYSAAAAWPARRSGGAFERSLASQAGRRGGESTTAPTRSWKGKTVPPPPRGLWSRQPTSGQGLSRADAVPLREKKILRLEHAAPVAAQNGGQKPGVMTKCEFVLRISLFRLPEIIARLDVHTPPRPVEAHLSIDERKDRVIAPEPHVFARQKLRSALPDDDIARDDCFAAKFFHAETFADAVPSVLNAALSFFMCHCGKLRVES